MDREIRCIVEEPTLSGRFFRLTRLAQIKEDAQPNGDQENPTNWVFEVVLLIPWLLIILGLIWGKVFPLFPLGLFLLLPTGLLVSVLQIFKTPITAKLVSAGMSRLQVRIIAGANLLLGIIGWMLIYVVTS